MQPRSPCLRNSLRQAFVNGIVKVVVDEHIRQIAPVIGVDSITMVHRRRSPFTLKISNNAGASIIKEDIITMNNEIRNKHSGVEQG